jgi:hypothetical protein
VGDIFGFGIISFHLEIMSFYGSEYSGIANMIFYLAHSNYFIYII